MTTLLYSKRRRRLGGSPLLSPFFRVECWLLFQGVCAEFSVAGPFFIVVCSICRKRVNVKTSKTDENGYAVHEECYVSKITPSGPANGKVIRRNWWKIFARL